VGEEQVATTFSITRSVRWNVEKTNPLRHANAWTNKAHGHEWSLFLTCLRLILLSSPPVRSHRSCACVCEVSANRL
jgi:hypothetical protein